MTNVEAAAGYSFVVACYDDNDKTKNPCYWNFTAGAFGAAEYVSSADLTPIRATDYHNIRIAVKRDDGADMDISEAENITFS